MRKPYNQTQVYSSEEPYPSNTAFAQLPAPPGMSSPKPDPSKLHKPRPQPLPLDAAPQRGPLKKFWYGEKVHKPTEYPSCWDDADIAAEEEFKRERMMDWKTLLNWRFYIRKEWWYWYPICVILLVLVILMTIYNDQIVDWLTPATNWMKETKGMWVIPIAALFVLSFPPLFGAEIVCILCGVVWGMWAGFGIVAAGTFAGEIGNYYAFKYCLRSRAEKYEKKNIHYACMAYVMRHGGFWICLLARLSAIPGHFTTAVFATCGMKFYIFFIATLFSLPKQGIVVYLGVLFQQKVKSNKERYISYAVLGVGLFLSIVTIWYIYMKMKVARLQVWRRARALEVNKDLKYDHDDDIPMEQLPPDDPLASAPILTHDDGFSNTNQLGLETDKHDSTFYARPYDIQYDRRNDMSIYQVNSDTGSDRVQMEQDITQRWNTATSYRNGAPPSSFSQPQSQSQSQPQPQRHDATPTRQDFSQPNPGYQSPTVAFQPQPLYQYPEQNFQYPTQSVPADSQQTHFSQPEMAVFPTPRPLTQRPGI